VGGAVRDLLLGRSPVDLDLAVEGPPGCVETIGGALAAAGFRSLARHARFGTATLRGPLGERIDLAATRAETYPRPGALPVVTPGVPIATDLGRRDFAIHAMALPLEGDLREADLVDPFGGKRDLGLRRIRLLHGESLADDPTRVFRAARYAARLGFALDGGFEEAMRRAVAAGAFATISGDRLRRAFEEVLAEENRAVAVSLLQALGVPSAVAEGWSLEGVRLFRVDGPGEPGAGWACLLERAAPAVREAVAVRLSFSRALRRAAGCSR